MSERKHTPGPWVVVPPDETHLSFATVCAEVGATIYQAPLTAETEANARLIAAAPDLLDALEALWEECRHGPNPFRRESASDLVPAAIAKARGQS